MGDTIPLHRQLGLTDDELAAIVELLEREPTELELAMYAVMSRGVSGRNVTRVTSWWSSSHAGDSRQSPETTSCVLPLERA
jgi:hypothetical protein